MQYIQRKYKLIDKQTNNTWLQLAVYNADFPQAYVIHYEITKQ